MLGEPRDRGPLRRGRIAIDRHCLTSFGHITQHWDFATQGVHVWIDHALAKDGGDRRIDGIAALAQDLSPYEGREVMLGGNHAVRAHDSWTKSHTHAPYPGRVASRRWPSTLSHIVLVAGRDAR